MWESVGPALAALLPTIGLSVLFYVVMRAIVNADRAERAAVRKMEAEQDQAVE